MSKRYNLKNIRTLLTEGFADEELLRLCYDLPDFRPVYDQLAQNTGKVGIIDRLIEYADRKLLIETLLTLAKEYNPARYEKHQPYDEWESAILPEASFKASKIKRGGQVLPPIADKLKLVFQLTEQDKHLEVRAVGQGGEGKSETALPPHTLLSQLIEYAPAHPPLPILESVGKSLYQCLMVGDVAKLASDVIQKGLVLGRPVQFELRFDANQNLLTRYPWELITDDLGRFLVYEGLVDITRYINYPQPPPKFNSMFHEGMLLRVISLPSNLSATTAINLVMDRVETIPHATFESLLRKLLIERTMWWGLQFEGFGTLVSQCRRCGAVSISDAQLCNKCQSPLSDTEQISALAFERSNGTDWISTKEFGEVLYNAGIYLALLSASETKQVGNRFIFNGLAPSLILAGVPAVIGMQYPVSDDFTSNFFNNFYRGLLKEDDILTALRAARKNTHGTWYSPVLYLRHQEIATVDEPIKSTYYTRNIDTAVPSEVKAGDPFLVRLWIRRPEAKPLTLERLSIELGLLGSTRIETREAEADIKFEPIAGKKLRRAEVEVKLNAIHCDVTPGSIKLFVDERLDAPPAIFTVQAKQVGQLSLLFSVWQDDGQIVSVVHHVRVNDHKQTQIIIETSSQSILVEDIAVKLSSSQEGKSIPTSQKASRMTCVNCRATNRSGANYCYICGAILPADQAPFSAPILMRYQPLPRPFSASNAQLVGDDGHVYPLNQSVNFIGRDQATCQIVFSGNDVSRQHAQIQQQRVGYILTDLGSRNGTFVNNRKLAGPYTLQPGDRISFGGVLCTFQIGVIPTPVPYPLPPELLMPAASKPILASGGIRHMTRKLTQTISLRMQQMSGQQLAGLAAALVVGITALTWLVGPWIAQNVPWLWDFLPLYFAAGPFAYALSNRKGAAILVHAPLHLLVTWLTWPLGYDFGPQLLAGLAAGGVMEVILGQVKKENRVWYYVATPAAGIILSMMVLSFTSNATFDFKEVLGAGLAGALAYTAGEIVWGVREETGK